MQTTDLLDKQPARIRPLIWPTALMLFTLAAFATAFWNLETVTPWWDEGWTLLVARHWLEQGHYGRFLAGVPDGPGLSAAFPSVASVVFSFKLFGVGVWQGRLPSLLYTAVALWLLYGLARRLYDQRVAFGTLAVLLLMTPHLANHPVVVGCQVLAEPLMICFLLAGYAAYLAVPRRPWLLWPLAIGMWALAIVSKGQTLPFWAVSLAVPLLLALIRGHPRVAGELGAAMAGSWILAQVLVWAQALLLDPADLFTGVVPGLTSTIALVPQLEIRLQALAVALVAGLPALLGIGYAAYQQVTALPRVDPSDRRAMVRLALLVFAGSWLAWFLLLSIGWARYFYPVTFVGSMFAAVWLGRLTSQFRLGPTIARAAGAIRSRRFDRRSIGALAALLVIALAVWLTSNRAIPAIFAPAHRAHLQMAHLQMAQYINHNTPDDALIESYDSEVFFLIDRPYHYPPDQTNVDLIRRRDLGQPVPNTYDPLSADPDYLVLSTFGRAAEIYDAALASGAFRHVQQYDLYAIYQRVR